MINKLIRFCLENKLLVALFAGALIIGGIMVAPFDWETGDLPRYPVPVDAIPDIGENQQIVFTKWIGRSPQDIEDQITYPLTSALMGLPQVKTIRSQSMFGFSSIYVIFKEDAEYYWTRSRILEKLNSLPAGTLPDGVTPKLGPDATALGQVFWYTLEGHTIPPKSQQSSNSQFQFASPSSRTLRSNSKLSHPTGGWDLQELRSIQDWYVRFALQGVDGVAEVASIGGFVKEYQVDVDPSALRAYGISLTEVFDAVRSSNVDVGARTVEVNSVEYVIRGLGLLKSLDDLRKTVVTQRNHIPITLDQVAEIEMGPALRRGALDKAGTEAVGGVVVARFGENPLEVIQRVKEKIEEIAPGLPQKTLEDGTVSQVRIVPFYDRSGLIYETLGTLESAVRHQILVTIIVVIVMMLHLRSALLVSSVLPLAVLFSFIGMKLFGVDANIVALSGIAIAIGTIVDMGIVLVENILKHLEADQVKRPSPVRRSNKDSLEIVHRACSEVGGAVTTAVLTTIISFLPVFTMVAAEGKLFKPLAYTKTFALVGSIVVALTIIPPLAHWIIAKRFKANWSRIGLWSGIALLGLLGMIAIDWFPWWLGLLLIGVSAFNLLSDRIPEGGKRRANAIFLGLIVSMVALMLANDWRPLGVEKDFGNVLFVFLSIGGLLSCFHLFIRIYPVLLSWILKAKAIFLAICLSILGWGIWIGANLAWEFMPDLDEGSFLFMPTTMTHASIGEAMDVLQKQDMAISAIPEVETVVGKIGRVDSALDPAPVSMIETVISYKSEYVEDEEGDILLFAFDNEQGKFERDAKGELVPDNDGRPFRQWRDSIDSPDDIWNEIVKAAAIPGTTSAPKLQPIATRLVMLQSGIRAPMAYRVKGPDLETIESVSLELERLLKQVPSVNPETVFADRVVGKPYLEIAIDREAIARYGIKIATVQKVIEVAIGGKPITQTVEGRERYSVRVRYLRELRDSIEGIENILVASPEGIQVPLKELASINYLRGPQAIKSEDTMLTGYVILDGKSGYSEVEVVEAVNAFLEEKKREGSFVLPTGVPMPEAVGSYQNQQRLLNGLKLIIPAVLFLIFVILYLQFKRVLATAFVSFGIFFALSGGMILLWLYGQDWFLDFELFDRNLRELFGMGTINLSAAVAVGFLALFGIATDNGVIVATYLQQSFDDKQPKTISEIRVATITAGTRRVRPAMMTSATTILALLPVLTSTGRGADIMVPMAIPTFGGMLLAILTIFVVPVLYCGKEELKLKLGKIINSHQEAQKDTKI